MSERLAIHRVPSQLSNFPALSESKEKIIRGVSLHGLVCTELEVLERTCEDANFINCHGYGLQVTNSYFVKSNFSFSQLIQSHVKKCYFEKVVINETILRYTIFENCIFNECEFQYSGASLESFRGLKVKNCHLNKVEFVSLSRIAQGEKQYEIEFSQNIFQDSDSLFHLDLQGKKLTSDLKECPEPQGLEKSEIPTTEIGSFSKISRFSSLDR